MTVVVSDTSCLILYDNLGLLDMLKQTFRTILITPDVAEEYGEPLPEWIKIVEINDKHTYLQLRETLGRGESSSIILAKEKSNSLLIID